MAQNATIFKATLHIADMDRHYYDDLQVTIARHPSETDERMMVRLLAFALHGQPELQFSRGLSTDNEPDIWRRELNGDIALWIDVGLVDENRIRKACHRAKEVFIYSYGGQKAQLWWRQISGKLFRYPNLNIIDLSRSSTAALAQLVHRTMSLQCNIDDGEICLGDSEHTVYIGHQRLLSNGSLDN